MAQKLLTQGEAELFLKKAHIRVMKHPETYMWAGILLMGQSTVVDNFPTAYTDGKNKRYGRAFISTLTIEELTALVLHENLHVALKHIPRYRDLHLKDDDLIGAAEDYVVNDMIMSLQDKSLCKLPDGGLYDPKFHGWNVSEVYNFLKKSRQQKQPKSGSGSSQGGTKPKPGSEKVTVDGNQYGTTPLDEHDAKAMDDLTPEEIKDLGEQINEALQQGALLAGRMKGGLPRQIREMLEPAVNWREELQEFVTSSTKGMDEFTWRKFNNRRVADDYYAPSSISESVGEIIFAIDTSGSIGPRQLAEAATELASVCEMCSPERVRVLWWDTEVHGEQIFEGNYGQIKELLKPMGGGGTRAGSVSDYMTEKNLNGDCVIMLTDGYCEGAIRWEINTPTLWLVTAYKEFAPPPGGRMVKFDVNN